MSCRASTELHARKAFEGPHINALDNVTTTINTRVKVFIEEVLVIGY